MKKTASGSTMDLAVSKNCSGAGGYSKQRSWSRLRRTSPTPTTVPKNRLTPSSGESAITCRWNAAASHLRYSQTRPKVSGTSCRPGVPTAAPGRLAFMSMRTNEPVRVGTRRAQTRVGSTPIHERAIRFLAIAAVVGAESGLCPSRETYPIDSAKPGGTQPIESPAELRSADSRGRLSPHTPPTAERSLTAPRILE
jgi:hypothetical protein